MKKFTAINPVTLIFIIISILSLMSSRDAAAQTEKTCPGGHKDGDNTINGRVRYLGGTSLSDTNNVTHGIVKLFRVNPPSLDVIASDSAHINSWGYYNITGVEPGSYYIVAYPGDKVEDYMISFYPSGQLWDNATKITVTQGQVRTCNIQSVVMNQAVSGTVIQGESADSLNHNYKLRNAIIIAKSGNQYRGFAFTDGLGRYVINSIASGSHLVTATRFGYRNKTLNVNVLSSPVTADFYMTRDSSYLISVANNSSVVKNFRLYQNYPNPFNPNTEIMFSLDKAMSVKVEVYSIEGKFIKELVNGYKPAGEYTLNFSGENLSSGIYNYVLETGNGQRESKLMVFTK